MKYGDDMADKVLKILGITDYRKMEGKYKPFDYICDETAFGRGKHVLREMKADRWTARTGNLAIECYNRGSPSGIETTGADYWNIYVEELGELYDIPVSAIKNAIRDELFEERKECGEGSICYLFHKDTFRPFRK